MENLQGKWYILYSKNKEEEKAREYFRKIGLDTIVPMIDKPKKKKVNGIIVTTIQQEPKYRNYVFVKHNGDNDFFDKCLGVENIISFAGGKYVKNENILPSALTNEDVDKIIKNEIKRQLRPDINIRVVYGPYAGQEGVVNEINAGMCNIKFKLGNMNFQESIPENFVEII